MSMLTGRCDLYDHVFSIGCYGSTDEMSRVEKFELFKKRTNGKIYQSYPLVLTKNNIEFELENNHLLTKNPDGSFTYVITNYKNLRELNKHGYYARREISFSNILDLFPYLSYVIASAASNPESETIYVASHSEVEDRIINGLNYGYRSDISYYQSRSNELLLDLIKEFDLIKGV